MKPVKITHQISWTSVRLDLVRWCGADDGSPKAAASGFLWCVDGVLYLVTNLHNCTGWDYAQNKALSDQSFTPNQVHVWLYFATDQTGVATTTMMRRSRIAFNLEDNNGNPTWFQHKDFGSSVDVAVLPLGDEQRLLAACENSATLPAAKSLATRPVNSMSDLVDFEVRIGDDAYVVGYPHGMTGGGFPIWKRASLATEPEIDIDDMPKLLIDTATRKGMSGSPVFACRRGLVRLRGAEGPQLRGDEIIGQAETFLGIYSGRVGEDPMGVQLGIVWKGSVIDEVIQGAMPGRWPWK